MWFGTHPQGCSEVIIDEKKSMLLTDFLRAYPEWNKKNVSDNKSQSAELPFLMKVLSVAKPLSIQAHPDLAFAAKLHKFEKC